MWYYVAKSAGSMDVFHCFSPQQTVIFRHSLRQCRVELPGEGPPLGLGSQPGDRAAGRHRCQRSGERLRKDGPMATSQGDLGAVEVPEGPNYMGYAGFCTMRFYLYLSPSLSLSIYVYIQPILVNFTPKNRFDLTISLVKHRDLCDKNWNRHNGIKSNLYH